MSRDWLLKVEHHFPSIDNLSSCSIYTQTFCYLGKNETKVYIKGWCCQFDSRGTPGYESEVFIQYRHWGDRDETRGNS